MVMYSEFWECEIIETKFGKKDPIEYWNIVLAKIGNRSANVIVNILVTAADYILVGIISFLKARKWVKRKFVCFG